MMEYAEKFHEKISKPCPECSKQVFDLKEYINKTHKKEHLYQCEECEKMYET